MEEVNIQKEILQKLEQSIDTAKSTVEDFSERKIAIQAIPWIIGKDLITTLDPKYLSGMQKYNNKYVFLRKTSSKQIVFPSGSVDKHEFHKGEINPQGLLLAAMREFKEELYGSLLIDADSFIDVYHPITFENNNEKYIQFRILAKIDPRYIEGLEQYFIQASQNRQDKHNSPAPEHDACYIASYDQALQYINSNLRNMKDSARLSLEHHSIANKWGNYHHKI